MSHSPSSSVPANSPLAQDAALCGGKIWVDLDNTPHVPFFKPIIRELEKRG